MNIIQFVTKKINEHGPLSIQFVTKKINEHGPLRGSVTRPAKCQWIDKQGRLICKNLN
jgi:hypothetical protein